MAARTSSARIVPPRPVPLREPQVDARRQGQPTGERRGLHPVRPLGRCVLHVGACDPTALAGTVHGRQVDALLLGQVPHQRGGHGVSTRGGGAAGSGLQFGGRDRRLLRRGRGRGSSRRLGSRVDHGHPCADRHGGPGVDEECADRSRVEAFDLDRRLRRLHHRDDIALCHGVAGPDQPLHEGALIHVRAERGHGEISHVSSPSGERRPRWPRAGGAPLLRAASHREWGPPRCIHAERGRRARRTPAR